MKDIVIPADVVPTIAATLHHYRMHLVDRRRADPFNTALVAELHRNWHATSALREALQKTEDKPK